MERRNFLGLLSGALVAPFLPRVAGAQSISQGVGEYKGFVFTGIDHLEGETMTAVTKLTDVINPSVYCDYMRGELLDIEDYDAFTSD